MQPLPPIGPARTNRALLLADLNQRNAQTLIRIAAETGDTPLTPAVTLSRLGDEAQLRGIPCIARGVQGAIAHTKPGA